MLTANFRINVVETVPVAWECLVFISCDFCQLVIVQPVYMFLRARLLILVHLVIF